MKGFTHHSEILRLFMMVAYVCISSRDGPKNVNCIKFGIFFNHRKLFDDTPPPPKKQKKTLIYVKCGSIIALEMSNCALIETHIFNSYFTVCSKARLFYFIVSHYSLSGGNFP